MSLQYVVLGIGLVAGGGVVSGLGCLVATNRFGLADLLLQHNLRVERAQPRWAQEFLSSQRRTLLEAQVWGVALGFVGLVILMIGLNYLTLSNGRLHGLAVMGVLVALGAGFVFVCVAALYVAITGPRRSDEGS